MYRMMVIVAFVFSFILPGFLQAKEGEGGLKTNYSKIFVQNLPIGKTISMKELVNLPLLIGNNFEVPIVVSIYPQKPDKPRAGFEAIPQANWVMVDSSVVTVPAQAEIQMDVKLNLPDDESLLGRKFQADIILITLGDPRAGGIKYGYQITGCFLFSVAPARNEEALVQALKNPADAAFSLAPPRVGLFNVQSGKKIRVLTAKNRKIVLTNKSSKKQKYYLASVSPEGTEVTPMQGYQFSGNPDQVVIKQDEIKLSPGKSKKLNLEINVPEDVDFEKGPLFYMVAVKSGGIQCIQRFIHIYLWGGERPANWELDKKTIDD